MQVLVNNIPASADILANRTFPIKVVRRGDKWDKKQLGHYADKRGVYILHSAGRIIYVGVTVAGRIGTFSNRFRRKFHPTSVGRNSKQYTFLAQQLETIYCVFLDLESIDSIVESIPISIPIENKALLLEQVLIGLYNPEGNAPRKAILEIIKTLN